MSAWAGSQQAASSVRVQGACGGADKRVCEPRARSRASSGATGTVCDATSTHRHVEVQERNGLESVVIKRSDVVLQLQNAINES